MAYSILKCISVYLAASLDWTSQGTYHRVPSNMELEEELGLKTPTFYPVRPSVPVRLKQSEPKDGSQPEYMLQKPLKRSFYVDVPVRADEKRSSLGSK